MQEQSSSSQRITEEVSSWPGVIAGPGPRGEFGFRVVGRELGHLHGDFGAHFSFPKKLGVTLREQERVVDHPVFPGKPGFAAHRIESDSGRKTCSVSSVNSAVADLRILSHLYK